MNTDLLIKQSLDGDKVALEQLISSIENNVYYLALRMLANQDDAKDATQDILIKIITNLSSFRFDSQFQTWAYKVASNHLINAKKVINKDPGLSFEMYAMDLEQDLEEPEEYRESLDFPILLNQMRISCTMAMLLCLNRAHRMAYILGDILEFEHEQASQVLDISKANFRKQLSRARKNVIEFTAKNCSLVKDSAKCSCDNKITGAIKKNRINPHSTTLADQSEKSYIEIRNILDETEQDLKSVTLQSEITHYKSPNILSEIIKNIVDDYIDEK